MTLRSLCSKCPELRWCKDGQGCQVGQHNCKMPYSVCKIEDLNSPYHRIIGPCFVVGIYKPTDYDINYVIEILEMFRHQEYVKKKLKPNMEIEGEKHFNKIK